MRRTITKTDIRKDIAAGGWVVLIEDKLLKTPEKNTCLCFNDAMAQAVADEWLDREWGKLDPDQMPLSQMLFTLYDRVLPQRRVLEDTILSYLDTDLLLYQVAEPKALYDRQQDVWEPVIQNIESLYDIQFSRTDGLAVVTHSDDVRQAIAMTLSGMNPYQFCAFQISVEATRSPILALAFYHGHIDSEHVFQACFLEELYKDGIYDAEHYGVDPHMQKTYNTLKRELESCQVFLQMCRDQALDFKSRI